MVNRNLSKSFNIEGSGLVDSYLQDDFIFASITEHTLKQDDKFPFTKYVLYRVDLISSIKKWSVWKRYSNFEEFRDTIAKIVTQVPDFPEKKIFNTGSSIIFERKTQLQNFLNFLLTKEKVMCYSEIREFIELDMETVRLILNKSNLEVTSNSLKSNTLLSSSEISKQETLSSKSMNINNYYVQFLDYKLADPNSKAPYMQLIEELLSNLEQKHQYKSTVIKNFDGFLKAKKSWPIFQKEEIQKLFFGEFDKKTEEFAFKGLLIHVGETEENQLGAEECLHFIIKLLECEYNPEYDKYLSILKGSIKKSYLESMNLLSHIHNNKVKIKAAAFKFLTHLDDKSQKSLKLFSECGLEEFYVNYNNSELGKCD